MWFLPVVLVGSPYLSSCTKRVKLVRHKISIVITEGGKGLIKEGPFEVQYCRSVYVS